MAETARQRYSFEEYVDLEEVSPAVKHEFLAGQVWAMAGGSPDHAAIAANVSALLSNQLRNRPCRVFSSDLRVRVIATGLGTYPDVTVVCGQLETDPADNKGHTVTNPCLVVEVLSPSTEDYDRGEKLEHYQQMPSLEAVVLVSHDEHRVTVVRRVEQAWLTTEYRDDAIELPSLGCTLPLAEVYRNPLS